MMQRKYSIRYVNIRKWRLAVTKKKFHWSHGRKIFMYALRVFLFFVLYVQLFRDDIKYLLSMETLWKKRRPPNPLDFDNLPHTGKCLHLPYNLVYTGGQCSKNVYTCINISIIWIYHKNISLNLFGVFCEFKEKYCAMDTKIKMIKNNKIVYCKTFYVYQYSCMSM